jgi:NADPH-dependent 2,4-dienoyl-CoA reductase/sulfur reductase-like enzyme
MAVREYYYRSLPKLAAEKKKVVVVGGGPAGMEAALVASSRGHSVVLFEKEDRLGGNLLAAAGPDFKADWKRYVEYVMRQMAASSVDVRLGTAGTAEAIRALAPDEVIVAVGAEPLMPNVAGADAAGVFLAADVMKGAAVPGEDVVVAGDGGMGMEAALQLARQGKRVALVELPGGSAGDLTVNFVDVVVLQDYLDEYGIRPRKGQVLKAVKDGKAVVSDESGQDVELPADAVVLAPVLRARTDIVDSLLGTAEEVRVVGDCREPRILFNAVHEAFEAALEI